MATLVLLAALSLALLAGQVVLCTVVLDAPELLRYGFWRRRLAERRFAAAIARGDLQQAEIQARRGFALQTHEDVSTGAGRDDADPIVSSFPASGALLWYL
jgi:hypothetical protein